MLKDETAGDTTQLHQKKQSVQSEQQMHKVGQKQQPNEHFLYLSPKSILAQM